MGEMDLLVGAVAAANFLGIKPRAIYHLVDTNQLPVTRKGRRLFFRKTELDKAFAASV
ncbi:helix-turn-helix domain-containing protein [Sphingomonas aerolata]|uniref:helix-turn-helix domain-containing protein n=1 Tax=Sphingomonas aerolata TaxID=185951 RepID=UPI002FDFB4FE